MVEQNNKSKTNSSGQFSVGDIVCLKSNPKRKGAILSIISQNPENRYNVFIDGRDQVFYETQLILSKEDQTLEVLSLKDFNACLTALQIRHPVVSALYSLNSARIDYVPYQFRPVLKFIRADRPRLLIADAVGVGKTIEAGLILKELQARQDVRSVLIICPRPLVAERKWEMEMKRFDERFRPLDGKNLRYCIDETDKDGTWPIEYQKAILPYSLCDEQLLDGNPLQKGLRTLNPSPKFDLVIVDEAHHVRNTDTFAHRAVRFFCENAEAAIFLTATPIQLDSQDLFVLLNLLRPDLIIDRGSFEHMAEPNPFINAAVSSLRTLSGNWQESAKSSLESAGQTAWGRILLQHNPVYQEVYKILNNPKIDDRERVALITKTESLHTFAGIINRTRRRDIGDFALRKPTTCNIDFTSEQRHLHDELLKLQAEILIMRHGERNVKFMMSTLRRQAASCIFGLAPLIKDIMNRQFDLTDVDSLEDEEYETDSFINAVKDRINSLIDLAERLDRNHDPKLDILLKILIEKQALPNNKIIIFSTFRHTLRYLLGHLIQKKLRVAMIHGDTPDHERLTLRERFQRPREDNLAIDVLLFSEVGTEGLDYQFCDCIVNYDLPWNPMRVEQRIGRIDRRGQKSQAVLIYNLVTPGTVDADIFERCLQRIGIFNRSLGASEEILGEITREIRAIAEDMHLNEEERRQKFQQLADNKIRLIQEQEKLEEQQYEFFGIKISAEQMEKDIKDSSSFWLSADALQGLVDRYLKNICGQDSDVILGVAEVKTLRLSQEHRQQLLVDFRKLPQKYTKSWPEWVGWLEGSKAYLEITFEAQFAVNTDITLLTSFHPLVRQAAGAIDFGNPVWTAFEVRHSAISSGMYPFAIYEWHLSGLRDDVEWQIVSISEDFEENLFELIRIAGECHIPDINMVDIMDESILEKRHYELWNVERVKHKARTSDSIQYRQESLSASHKARVALINDQLTKTTDEKIRIMRNAELERIQADFKVRMEELEEAKSRADITASPVAYGVVHVKKDNHGK